MDLKDKKTKRIVLIGAAVLCIALLALSSSLKNKKAAPRQTDTPAVTAQQPAAEENTRLDEEWNRYDERNEIVKKKSDSTYGAPSRTSAAETVQAGTPEEDAFIPASYPPPSFVSSSGDTLIWGNGIYQRVDWVKPPEEKPDTLVLNGKTYIELLENQ